VLGALNSDRSVAIALYRELTQYNAVPGVSVVDREGPRFDNLLRMVRVFRYCELNCSNDFSLQSVKDSKLLTCISQ